jgi:hypothetical protein
VTATKFYKQKGQNYLINRSDPFFPLKTMGPTEPFNFDLFWAWGQFDVTRGGIILPSAWEKIKYMALP